MVTAGGPGGGGRAWPPPAPASHRGWVYPPSPPPWSSFDRLPGSPASWRPRPAARPAPDALRSTTGASGRAGLRRGDTKRGCTVPREPRAPRHRQLLPPRHHCRRRTVPPATAASGAACAAPVKPAPPRVRAPLRRGGVERAAGPGGRRGRGEPGRLSRRTPPPRKRSAGASMRRLLATGEARPAGPGAQAPAALRPAARRRHAAGGAGGAGDGRHQGAVGR